MNTRIVLRLRNAVKAFRETRRNAVKAFRETREAPCEEHPR
jgi:hypothetical protein